MTTRDEILSRLRPKRREETRPAAWQSRRRFPDLAARFTEALTAAKGEVLRAPDLDAALEQVDVVLAELGAQRVIANREAPLANLNLREHWPEIDWYLVGRTPGDLRGFAAQADAGLSSADVALAETGTIVVSSGPGKSRLATLLPPLHLALVPTSRLTADLFTWTAARSGPPPANLTLISGPSKTADIEMTLAVGVHGPKRLVVVLYDD